MPNRVENLWQKKAHEKAYATSAAALINEQRAQAIKVLYEEEYSYSEIADMCHREYGGEWSPPALLGMGQALVHAAQALPGEPLQRLLRDTPRTSTKTTPAIANSQRSYCRPSAPLHLDVFCFPTSSLTMPAPIHTQTLTMRTTVTVSF